MLVSGGPVLGPAGHIAQRLGLGTRFQLARALKRDGIPPLHRLRSWFAVLRWVWTAERDAVSLCRVAFASRTDPAACYRRVKRVTGRTWKDVRSLGSRWVLTRIADLLHPGKAPYPHPR
ncbi:MAG: hypothetical protein ACREMN_05540 [Gemmatimonadales bacterium]